MTDLSGEARQKKPRRRSRPRPERRPRLVWLRSLRLIAVVHPARCAAFAVAGLLLVAFITTTSLPLAVADRDPHLALLLYPDHPKALLALAHEERLRMAAATAQSEEQAAASEQAGSAPIQENGDTSAPPSDSSAEAADSIAKQEREHAASLARPDGGQEPEETPEEPAQAQPEDIPAMRARIRDLAKRVLAKAPLSASAYRLMGDVAEDLGTSRQAMLEAVARSRRETVAAFWLMHQDYEQRDYTGVVRMADLLLQTRPALNRYTLSYLNSLALTPEGREALVAALVKNPSWRWGFLLAMNRQLATTDAPLALFQALKEAGSPPSEAELVPLLRARMVADRRAEEAYNVWLQMLPAEDMLKVRPVNNLDFAADPSNLPFNWNIPRSTNAFVDLQRRQDGAAGRVLRIRFGVGRVRFGTIEQITFLRPGSYRFSGEQKGLMSAKRGMVWQVSCYPSGPVAGQSSQLLGSPREWRSFSFDITIPDNGRCDAQRLRLFHDSRSTSEQFASGEIQFQSLSIAPIEPENTEGG